MRREKASHSEERSPGVSTSWMIGKAGMQLWVYESQVASCRIARESTVESRCLISQDEVSWGGGGVSILNDVDGVAECAWAL